MKFLRGKIWQIALAVCMLAVLLCITASAESQTATILFAGESVSVGGSEPTEKFFFTSAEGKLVDSLDDISASDNDYHVKLNIENDKVNLYLNGATITYEENGYAMQVVSTTTNGLTVNVIVEKDSTINNSSNNGLSFGSYYDAVLNGPGKLTVNAANLGISIGKSLTVAGNGNLEASAQGNYTVMGAADAKLDVNGGKASFSGGDLATLNVTNLEVSNKANVTIEGVWATTVTKLDVNDSRLEMTGSNGCIYNKDTDMNLTFTEAVSGYVVKTGTSKETATDYTGQIKPVPFGNDAGQFSRFSKYVLIAPKFELTVEDQEKTTTQEIMGEEVTVSATGVTESVKFDSWTVVSPAEGFALPNPENANITFTMPANDVSLKANYITTATVQLNGNDYTFSDKEPQYYTTTDGNVFEYTGADPEENYNIKLAFESNVPTIFLKDANISSSGTAIKGSNFAINTKKASHIAQTGNTTDNSAAIAVTGKLTFTGSELLSVEGVENVIYGTSAQLEFVSANVKLDKTTGITWGDAAISGSVSEITFTGGTVNIESSYMALYSTSTNGMDVTAKQNTIVDVNCVNVFSWNQTDLIVDNSRLNIAGGNNYNLFNNENSTVAVKNGGELELETSGNKGLLAKAPDLSNYQGEHYQGEYYAVMGDDASSATEYNGTEALSKKYFRIGKKATVNVTNGTVKGPYAAEADETATVIVGDTVTLFTDNTDGTFSKWTVVGENSGTFGDSNTASTTFTVLVSEVKITAEHGKKVLMTAFGGRTLTVVEGGPAIYYKVNGTNNNVSKITEGEYNIMFVYPKGGTPTLTLKGVTLTANGEINAAIGDLVIEVLGENRLAGGITTTDTNLTICTPEGQTTGSLELSSGSSYTLYSKKATADSFTVTLENVNMTLVGSSSGTFRLAGAEKLHVKGGSLTITANNVNGIYCDGADTEVFLEETQATIITGSDKIGLFNSSGTITIKDSNVRIGSADTAIRIALVSNQMEINNSTVEAFTTTRVYSGTPNLVGDYFAVAGAASSSATQYTGTALSEDQKYFKIVPAFTLTVTDGKADFTVGNVTVNNATKAPAGVSVTITGNETKEDLEFAKWSSEDVQIENLKSRTATFNMPQKAVTVAANYGAVAQVTIDDGPETFVVKAVEGGATRYYRATIENGVVVVEEVDQANANIVFVYPDDEDKKPQLTLNGVVLNDYRICCNADTPELTIDVQGENKITNDGIVLLFYGTDLEFVGNGQLKLNATATKAAIAMMGSNNSLTLNGGTIIASAPAATYCVTANAAEVNVNSGSTLVVVAKDDENACTGIYGTNKLVINGGTVQIPRANIGLHIPLEVQSGSLEIGNTVTIGNEDIAGDVEIGFANTIDISGGYVEVNAGAVSSKEITVTIGEDCVAVLAPNKDAFIENPEGYAYTADRDTRSMGYFLVEPKVVEVTITWGAMSFTYTGSIWNVETLKWEGRWEPTVSEDSEAASMDGYDSALASNQIKVVNSGTVTVNVSFRFNPDANFGSDYGTVNGAFVTRKPYYFSNWDPVDSSEFPYIWSKAYFGATRNGTEVTVSYKGETSISGMAAKLKEVFDQYPENANMRIINITAVERQFLSEQTENYVFMEKGVEALAQWVDEFLEAYKNIGGKLDAIYSDLEYNDGYAWYLYNDHYRNGETDVFYNITQHSSYQTEIRRKLEERGFEFYSTPADASDADKREKCELYTLVGSSSANEKSRYTWDAVVRDLLCDYLDEAIYKPLQEHYPNAYFTDYQSRDTYGWMKLMNGNAYNTYRGGNTQKAGTHSSYNAYNYAPQWVTTKSETDTSYKKPVSYNGAVFEDNAFHMTQWETNNFKAMYAATDSKKIEITLTYYDYAIKMREEWRNNQDATSSGTPYHIEGYLHAGLLDPEFGGYVIKSNVEHAEYPSSTGSYSDALKIISDIMLTLNRVVGYSDRKPIETPLNWNDSFILSGMYANGRNVWRITPDTTSGVSKQEFLDSTDGGQIVFKIKGQTITFPQGSIINEPVTTFPDGTCGYWVETPADVMPIVTNDEKRYEKYPAYAETFDNYTVGQDFNSQYSHTWELGDSSATIQQNGDDKFLAIQGDASLNNVKLPEYITAGDNYAKQQAWELDFKLDTLPTGDAEVILLSAASDSGSNTDGGFRVYNNGQLDYSTASGYQAFNITLAANTEYTVKRVFNFRTANSFTCSYYVYDANGSELAKAENVEISSLSLPVQKIGISTANFDANTLYVDDYKLYATGVTTDLEVYNADTGIQVNASVLREGNTAYRLSWMNASDATKYYNVVATYDDGTEEIVKSIEMQPGCDGVNTGIVKVDDGKSVTISLEETDTKVPDAGDNAGDDGSSNGSNSANGEDTTITLTRSQEADAYLYLSSGYVAVFDERKTLGTVTVTINAITPAQEGGNA